MHHTLFLAVFKMAEAGEEIQFKFLTHKVHSLRGKYHRIFGLKHGSFVNIDPKDFNITNEWSYRDVIEITPNEDPSEFTVVLPKDSFLGFGSKTQEVKFACEHRTLLLSEMRRLWVTSRLTGPLQRFAATKLTRLERRTDCWLEPGPSSLNVLDNSAQVVSQYDYKDIAKLQLLADQVGLVVVHGGRGRVFLCPEKTPVINQIRNNSAQLGIRLVVTESITWEQCVDGIFVFMLLCDAYHFSYSPEKVRD
jgi:hypothetical protein